MALFNIFVDFILEGPFWVEISSNAWVHTSGIGEIQIAGRIQ